MKNPFIRLFSLTASFSMASTFLIKEFLEKEQVIPSAKLIAHAMEMSHLSEAHMPMKLGTIVGEILIRRVCPRDACYEVDDAHAPQPLFKCGI